MQLAFSFIPTAAENVGWDISVCFPKFYEKSQTGSYRIDKAGACTYTSQADGNNEKEEENCKEIKGEAKKQKGTDVKLKITFLNTVLNPSVGEHLISCLFFQIFCTMI